MAHTSIAVSEPSTSSVTDASREFPATERLAYMDVAARGMISRAVRAALDTHLDVRMLGSAEEDEYFALVERARGRFAQLINADPDEVALTRNVSEGLNTVAAGVPWQAGDNVVLCPNWSTRTTSIAG
jgi:cysteine desulfurase/selenocysteine lyase